MVGQLPPIWFLVVLLLPPIGLLLFVIGAVKQLKAERARNQDADEQR